MNPKLLNYLSLRAKAFCESSDLRGISFHPGPQSESLFSYGVYGDRAFPVVLGDQVFGTLKGNGSQETLESFAGQMASLLAYPAPEDAIVIDEEIEKLHRSNPHFDWTGVYRVEASVLKLTAFRGAATPHAIISKDHGICGAAVRENRTLNIDDVTLDERYLSCDSRTRSELVVPIRNSRGQAIGELDIDSHALAAFGPEDEARLEGLAAELAALLEKLS